MPVYLALEYDVKPAASYRLLLVDHNCLIGRVLLMENCILLVENHMVTWVDE